MGETAHSSVLTAKRIKSPKWVLFASCILAAAADIFVLAVLGAGGFAGRHFVCPSVLLALDVLFAAGILLSNFRYRYSIAEVVVYLVGAALLICLTVLVDMSGGKTTYVTRAASVCWIVFHALACLSVLASALYAAKLRRVFKSGAAICICALLAAACVFLFASQYMDHKAWKEAEISPAEYGGLVELRELFSASDYREKVLPLLREAFVDGRVTRGRLEELGRKLSGIGPRTLEMLEADRTRDRVSRAWDRAL